MEANVVIDGVKYNYHVTKDGRVFSLNYRHTGKAKERKYGFNKKGYRQLVLYTDGRKTGIRVAKLVALTYIPNPENKPTVDHINRIRTDDRVENLRWADYSEQCYNRKEMPKNRRGSKAVMCIETGEIYPSASEITRQLGFHRANITNCCNGKRKIANGFHWQYVNE